MSARVWCISAAAQARLRLIQYGVGVLQVTASPTFCTPLPLSSVQGCMQDWLRPFEPADLGPARVPHPAVLPLHGPGWRLPLPAGSPAQQHKAASSSSTGEAQRVADREAAATACVQHWRQRQQRAACAQAGGACVRPGHPQPLRQALSLFVCVLGAVCFSCKCAPATVTAASAHRQSSFFVWCLATAGLDSSRVVLLALPGSQPAPLLNLSSSSSSSSSKKHALLLWRQAGRHAAFQAHSAHR